FVQAPSLRVRYVEEGGRTSELRLARGLPVPLAMPLAWLRVSGIGARERRRGLVGLASAALGAPADWSLEEWIERRRQHGAPRRFLWDPLCHAVMNAPAADVGADVF